MCVCVCVRVILLLIGKCIKISHWTLNNVDYYLYVSINLVYYPVI